MDVCYQPYSVLDLYQIAKASLEINPGQPFIMQWKDISDRLGKRSPKSMKKFFDANNITVYIYIMYIYIYIYRMKKLS